MARKDDEAANQTKQRIAERFEEILDNFDLTPGPHDGLAGRLAEVAIDLLDEDNDGPRKG